MADPDLVLENLHIGKCFQYNTSEVYKTYNRAFLEHYRLHMEYHQVG